MRDKFLNTEDPNMCSQSVSQICDTNLSHSCLRGQIWLGFFLQFLQSKGQGLGKDLNIQYNLKQHALHEFVACLYATCEQIHLTLMQPG